MSDSVLPHESQHTSFPVHHRTASLSITNSQSLLKLMSIELVMPSSHLILCRPLLLLPPILPSIRVFSNESALHMRWPKCWSFSFSISPSNEHPGLISFRMDWLDLLAVPTNIPCCGGTTIYLSTHPWIFFNLTVSTNPMSSCYSLWHMKKRKCRRFRETADRNCRA